MSLNFHMAKISRAGQIVFLNGKEWYDFFEDVLEKNVPYDDINADEYDDDHGVEFELTSRVYISDQKLKISEAHSITVLAGDEFETYVSYKIPNHYNSSFVDAYDMEMPNGQSFYEYLSANDGSWLYLKVMKNERYSS